MPSFQGQTRFARHPIDSEELVHLFHDPNRFFIQCIKFHCIDKFSASMRPTRRIHDFGATHLVVGSVSIALEDSFKVSQKLFRPFSVPTKPELEDRRTSRPAILP